MKHLAYMLASTWINATLPGQRRYPLLQRVERGAAVAYQVAFHQFHPAPRVSDPDKLRCDMRPRLERDRQSEQTLMHEVEGAGREGQPRKHVGLLEEQIVWPWQPVDAGDGRVGRRRRGINAYNAALGKLLGKLVGPASAATADVENVVRVFDRRQIVPTQRGLQHH